MKKIVALFTVLTVFSVVLAGCAEGGSTETSGSEQKDTKEDKKDKAAAMISYVVDVQHAISAANAPMVTIGSYIDAKELAKEDLKAIKSAAKKATKAGETLKSDLSSIKIPEGLSSSAKDKINAALDDLKQTIKAKSEAAQKAAEVKTTEDIKKVADNISKAGEKSFTNFSDKMNKVITDLDLIKVDFHPALEG